MGVKVGYPGMEIQELLGPLRTPEPKPTSFLLSCVTVRLLDEIVAAGSVSSLLVLHGAEHQQFSDRGAIASELVSMDGLWSGVFPQQTDEEGLRRPRITLRLK